MHSHLRARFGFCNDHIWPLNAFKMVLMFQEVGLRAGSDAAYRASGGAQQNPAFFFKQHFCLEAICGLGGCFGKKQIQAVLRSDDLVATVPIRSSFPIMLGHCDGCVLSRLRMVCDLW
jgi:hypothetical protein